MTTLQHPGLALSGTLNFTLSSHRRIRAAVFNAPPAYRICRAKYRLETLRTIKHQALSQVVGGDRALATSSCWSRA